MKKLLVMLILTNLCLWAEVGSVERYKGRVDLLKRDSLRGVPLDRAEPKLDVGDILRTKRDGYAYVSFIDGSKVELFELSRLKIIDYTQVREVSVQRGVVKFEVTSQKGVKGYRVKTPHAIIGVKGTTFWVYVFPGFTRVVLEEGEVTREFRFQTKTNGESWEQSTQMTVERNNSEEPFAEKPPVETILEVKLQ